MTTRAIALEVARELRGFIPAGPSRAKYRAALMTRLLGHRVPQSRAGYGAVRDTLYRMLEIDGTCEAERIRKLYEIAATKE